MRLDHRYEVLRLGDRFACFWITRDDLSASFDAAYTEIPVALAALLLRTVVGGEQLNRLLPYGMDLPKTSGRFELAAAAEKYLTTAVTTWRGPHKDQCDRLVVNAYNTPVAFKTRPMVWGARPVDDVPGYAVLPLPGGGHQLVLQTPDPASDKPNHADPLSEYHRRRAQSRLLTGLSAATCSAVWRTFPRAQGTLQTHLSDLVMRPVLVAGRPQIPLKQYLNETEISVLVIAEPQDAVQILTEGGHHEANDVG